MSVGSALKGNISGALGNLERAAILFPSSYSRSIQLEEDNSRIVEGSSSPALNLAYQKLKGNKVGNALGHLDFGIREAVKATWDTTKGDSTKNIFLVQFNPSSIHISAVGGGNFAVASYGGNDSGVNFQGLNARIDVSMTLIMDAVSNKEAFGQDKLIVEPVELAKAAAAGAATAAGKNYSVLQQVEGFHAAMRVMDFTQVKFVWGKSVLQGGLTRANSRYTMFSPTGNPIRAEMGITITCLGEAVKKWKEAYDREFAGKDYITTQTTAQTLNGLLNL